MSSILASIFYSSAQSPFFLVTEVACKKEEFVTEVPALAVRHHVLAGHLYHLGALLLALVLELEPAHPELILNLLPDLLAPGLVLLSLIHI